jgi:thiol-disulfide isomerase/thioredoxin
MEISTKGLPGLISQEEGAITLLHFWATWCPPCVKEFPDIVRLHESFKGRRLRVVLVSAGREEDIAKVRAFLTNQGVDWETYRASNLNDEFIKAVSPNWSGALPASFYYYEGKQMSWHEGLLPLSGHVQSVNDILELPTLGGEQ